MRTLAGSKGSWSRTLVEVDINKQVYKRTSIWKYMCMNDLDLIQYSDAILGSHVNTSLRKEMQDNE